MPSSSKPSSILLVRLSSLGDVVLATPLARALRRTFPEARIDVAVAAEFADVWKNNPHINEVLTVDRKKSAPASALALRRDASMKRYDMVVDLQNNIRSLFLRLGFAHRSVRCKKYRHEKRALVKYGSKAAALPHVVSRYFEAVSSLGVRNSNDVPELWLEEDVRSERSESQARSCGSAVQRGDVHRVVVAPGAKHATKRWITEGFARTIHELATRGYEVHIVGSKEDRTVCTAVYDALTRHARECTTLKMVDTLEQTIRIVDAASCVLANDSSIVHMAAARGIPVAVIYGSTVPALGFTPYGVRHVVVETAEACRPCTHIGRAECPQAHFRCMRSIQTSAVIDAVVGLCEEKVQ